MSEILNTVYLKILNLSLKLYLMALLFKTKLHIPQIKM